LNALQKISCGNIKAKPNPKDIQEHDKLKIYTLNPLLNHCASKSQLVRTICIR
jgi:hypothetical protein